LLPTRKDLEDRWEKVDSTLTAYRQANEGFGKAQTQYLTKAHEFFSEHDGLGLYRGEWRRQREFIRSAEDFFRAAGFDPFALSDKLVGIDRDAILTMPDEKDRAALEARTPDPFPTLPESRIEERTQRVLREVSAAVEVLDPSVVKPIDQCPVTLPELAVCVYAAFVARYVNGQPHPRSGWSYRKVTRRYWCQRV
jgi:hypothetical protein